MGIFLVVLFKNKSCEIRIFVTLVLTRVIYFQSNVQRFCTQIGSLFIKFYILPQSLCSFKAQVLFNRPLSAQMAGLCIFAKVYVWSTNLKTDMSEIVKKNMFIFFFSTGGPTNPTAKSQWGYGLRNHNRVCYEDKRNGKR